MLNVGVFLPFFFFFFEGVDVVLIRVFSLDVELKELQMTYRGLVVEVQSVLDVHVLQHQRQQHQHQQQSRPQSRAESPSFLTSISKPKSQNRSNTNPPAPSSSLHSLPQSQVQPFHHPQHLHPQLTYKQLASAFYTINSKYHIS
jgi:hypothetical protein